MSRLYDVEAIRRTYEVIFDNYYTYIT